MNIVANHSLATSPELRDKYARVSANVDFGRMSAAHVVVAGAGASTGLVKSLARLGVRNFTLIDPDIVEDKNLAAQDFERADIGTPKVEALAAHIERVCLEKKHPGLPPLDVRAYQGDFVQMPEELLFRCEGKPILLMATDFHPAQAWGNVLALKFGVLAFWVGVYRGGGAGEIIFYQNGYDLPCYRCIVSSRYAAYDRTASTGRGHASVSSGLPFAVDFIDAIVGHLLVGAVHFGEQSNPHAAFFERLLREKRNFIQVQLDPDYRLRGETDIFAEARTPNGLCFNTLFQEDRIDSACPDCNSALRGRGRASAASARCASGR